MATATETEKGKEKHLVISAPNFQSASFQIEGTAPYVQLRFSQKAIEEMKEKMKAGSQSRSKKTRKPRDFEADYEAAFHRPTMGGCGIPAAAFRNAFISACRIVGFTMTRAKLAVFVEADDIDTDDGMPLVWIEGDPDKVEHYVRNETGVVDIRVRAMWKKWSANLRVRFDADMFSLQDIANLVARAGAQVGVGEGRPDGKKSAGMGWGLFRIKAQTDD